ncbi:hypothetical protein Q1695_002994 [Nippostrongylus brasiliensis]|nr:hypothetical protein Q1695_002994 [Nippostrongylus brasiliensis]
MPVDAGDYRSMQVIEENESSTTVSVNCFDNSVMMGADDLLRYLLFEIRQVELCEVGPASGMLREPTSLNTQDAYTAVALYESDSV